MAMKPCKECNQEISSTAKKCPSCGKDQRNWFMKHKILTVIIAFLVIGIIGAASGGNKSPAAADLDNGAAAIKPTAAVSKEVIVKAGDKITMDGLEIIVTSITQKASVGSEYLKAKPAEGGTYIIVNFSYENVSDKPINSFTSPKISLLDKKGTQYDNDLNATVYYTTEKKIDAKIFSDLNPGIKVKDAKVYEVSKKLYKAGGWRLFIEADKETYLNIN